jgi:hypothetical protein
MMKEAIVIGVMLGVAGLGEHAPAQKLKPPDAVAAQTQGEAKPAADELITLLETKGILTETEAALLGRTELLPETRQVLAEMLLSKQLISEKEYDETLRSCSGSAAPAEAESQRAAPYILGPDGNGEPGRFKSFSDWIASILPGGGQTTDLDFGTIQPSPMWPQGDEPEHARAKVKRKSHKQNGQDASETAPARERWPDPLLP